MCAGRWIPTAFEWDQPVPERRSGFRAAVSVAMPGSENGGSPSIVSNGDRAVVWPSEASTMPF